MKKTKTMEDWLREPNFNASVETIFPFGLAPPCIHAMHELFASHPIQRVKVSLEKQSSGPKGKLQLTFCATAPNLRMWRMDDTLTVWKNTWLSKKVG